MNSIDATMGAKHEPEAAKAASSQGTFGGQFDFAIAEAFQVVVYCLDAGDIFGVFVVVDFVSLDNFLIQTAVDFVRACGDWR
jgi:hypothetical protein